MRYKIRRQEGDNSTGTANDFGKKKENSALRDKTCPVVDVASCCGLESAVHPTGDVAGELDASKRTPASNRKRRRGLIKGDSCG